MELLSLDNKYFISTNTTYISDLNESKISIKKQKKIAILKEDLGEINFCKQYKKYLTDYCGMVLNKSCN